MEKFCMVCDMPFKDGDRLAAVMLSTFKEIESDVHYAITTPTQCIEIVHLGCYDGPIPDEPPQIGGIN